MKLRLFGCLLGSAILVSIVPQSAVGTARLNQTFLPAGVRSISQARGLGGAAMQIAQVNSLDLLNRSDFFERGMEELEYEVRDLDADKPFESLLTVKGKQIRWQQVVLKQGGFSILMPVGELERRRERLATGAGTLNFEALLAEAEKPSFAVAYTKILDAAWVKDPYALLDQVRDAIVEDTQSQLRRDRTISFGDNPGQELILEKDDEVLTLRMYAIQERLYILGVLQSSTDDFSQAAIAFFDSFRLLQ